MPSNKTNTVQIDSELYERMREFCQLNSMTITSYVNSVLKKNLMIDMYGDSPFVNIKNKRIIEPVYVPDDSEEVVVSGSDDVPTEPLISVVDTPTEKNPEKEEVKEEVTEMKAISKTTVAPIVNRKRRLT